MDVLFSVLYEIQSDKSGVNKSALVREACAEFAEYIAPILDREGRLDWFAPSSEGNRCGIPPPPPSRKDSIKTRQSLVREGATFFLPSLRASTISFA